MRGVWLLFTCVASYGSFSPMAYSALFFLCGEACVKGCENDSCDNDNADKSQCDSDIIIIDGRSDPESSHR